jgi:ubiquinone/menaquinone biosynthesis C-methylase UbiE
MSFDAEAKEWDLDPKKTERAVALANEILKNVQFPPDAKAMEFGCGTGILSVQMKDVFQEITLVDTSSGMIDVLKEKIEANKLDHFHPLLIDLLTEPLPNVHFDVIYTLMTMHHIRDIETIISVFHRLLKPGAYFCMADLVKEDGSFHNDPNFDGHNGFEHTELTQLMQDSGFEVIEYNIFYKINREKEGKHESYPLFLMIARKN